MDAQGKEDRASEMRELRGDREDAPANARFQQNTSFVFHSGCWESPHRREDKGFAVPRPCCPDTYRRKLENASNDSNRWKCSAEDRLRTGRPPQRPAKNPLEVDFLPRCLRE